MREDREVVYLEDDSGSGLKWFVLGAALGAGIGLLFAPKSGARTRRDLARRGRKLRARAERGLDDITEKVQERGRQIRETVEELADEVVDEVRDGKRRIERSATSARDDLERRLSEARARARAAVAGALESDVEADEPTG